jgi:hypothetical protein
MKKMMAQMSRGGMLGGLGRKMMGGLAGGLGGLLGGGGDMGLGAGDDDFAANNGAAGQSLSQRIKRKKKRKKRK